MLKKKISFMYTVAKIVVCIFSKLKRFWYAQKKGTRKFET